jgi:hypothetical protein
LAYVKLAEPLKLHFEQVPERFARDLRVIGQDLANLFPYDLEIELQGTDYVARGHCARKRLEAETPKTQKPTLKSAFVKLLNRDVQAPFTDSEPEVGEFSRSYSRDDIDRLDSMGTSHRTGMDRIPDARSLGESLRTIGRLLDINKGQLLSLARNQDHVTVEYRDQNDAPQKEELKNFEIYKLQQRFYKARGTAKVRDGWQGHDE